MPEPSTASVRPPAASAPRWAAVSTPPPAPTRPAPRGETRGEPLGAGHAVRRRPPRAHDRDRERVVRGERAAHVERGPCGHGGEERRIAGIAWLETVHRCDGCSGTCSIPEGGPPPKNPKGYGAAA